MKEKGQMTMKALAKKKAEWRSMEKRKEGKKARWKGRGRVSEDKKVVD